MNLQLYYARKKAIPLDLRLNSVRFAVSDSHSRTSSSCLYSLSEICLVSIQHGFASHFCRQEVTTPHLRLNSHEDGRGSSTFLGEQVSTSAKQIYPKRDGTIVTASLRLLDASVLPPWTFLILSERTGRRTSWRFVEVVDFPQTCSSKSFLAMY